MKTSTKIIQNEITIVSPRLLLASSWMNWIMNNNTLVQGTSWFNVCMCHVVIIKDLQKKSKILDFRLSSSCCCYNHGSSQCCRILLIFNFQHNKYIILLVWGWNKKPAPSCIIYLINIDLSPLGLFRANEINYWK